MSSADMASLAKPLITALSGVHDPDKLEGIARRVAAKLKADSHGSSRKEWTDVRSSLQGNTARIRVKDDVAAAYDKLVAKLEEHRRRGGTAWDENLELNSSYIPQHVQLLLNLSKPTDERTQRFAEEFLVRLPEGDKPQELLYEEIMAEPFEGDHWGDGYNEEVSEGWKESEGSDSDFTPNEDEVVTPSGKPVYQKSAAQRAREAEAQRRSEEEQRLMLAKLTLREVTTNAYWRTGGVEFQSSKELRGWQSLSAVPALASPALSSTSTKAISSRQLQRELLFALSGRPGVMFSFGEDGNCSVARHHPNVMSFSPDALDGILTSFAGHISEVGVIRRYVAEALAPLASSSKPPPLHRETQDAFAAACQKVLHKLDAWVAELESTFMGAQPVTSAIVPISSAASTPLVLSMEFTRRYGDLINYLRDLIPFADDSNELLNAIYGSISDLTSQPVRSELIDIFVQTATPMWRLLRSWLVDGMPVPESLKTHDADLALQAVDDELPLSPEFFIRRDRDSAWSDEDFWEAGFVVVDGGWPSWLQDTEEEIMEGGKAMGLLRSLSLMDNTRHDWVGLDEIVTHDTQNIPQALADYLLPICTHNQALLAQVLEWDCALQRHLTAIDGLTLMRGPVVANEWADWLFEQMSCGKPWADFQLLTSSLRDAIETHGATWMNAPAVRARTTRRSGRAVLADIRVDYLVPFPLSQLFTPTAVDLRSDIFVFLLRLVKGRKVLLEARMLAESYGGARPELRLLRKLRHALSWVLDSLWNWVNNLIEVHAAAHSKKIETAPSFYAMIRMEMRHVRKLRGFCFLDANASSASRIIDVILNMAEELHVAAGPSTTDPSAIRGPPPRPPRRRRKRDPQSDDDSDDDDTSARFNRTAMSNMSLSSSAVHLDSMADRLNTQVRRFRREVEGLASDGGADQSDTRETWSVLAFSLEDWKDV
ncbi:hypothetical protein Q8F55_004222 [Vanrija albida]|uniref:Spindle pole body component n=1 Tax=Vanrija albida TaxID=181172 RepID=A0ABR3Q6G4_9TREE